MTIFDDGRVWSETCKDKRWWIEQRCLWKWIILICLHEKFVSRVNLFSSVSSVKKKSWCNKIMITIIIVSCCELCKLWRQTNWRQQAQTWLLPHPFCVPSPLQNRDYADNAANSNSNTNTWVQIIRTINAVCVHLLHERCYNSTLIKPH